MASVHSLLSRVARLEMQRRKTRSPIQTAYGSYDAFEDKVKADVQAGKLDTVEMPMVLAALRRWQFERQH
jgi:outer membrane murein-binding lipoprotein Lpp